MNLQRIAVALSLAISCTANQDFTPKLLRAKLSTKEEFKKERNLQEVSYV